MNFPTLVYRTPGTHFSATGTYDYRAANSQEDLVEAMAHGWFMTLQEAIDGEHAAHEGKNQQSMELGDLPQDLAIEFVQHWLGHRLEELGIDQPEVEEGELLELKMLDAIRIDAAAIALQSAIDSDAPQKWLMDKATELGLEVGDGLTSDELLFFICHEFAKPSDDAPPTREELETKAVMLAIKFDGRTTDKSLAEKIELAIAEQEQ